MAEQNPPVFLQAGTYPAEDVRSAFGSLMFSSGVMGEHDFNVIQSLTPAMSVNVLAGSAWVPGTEGTYQGSYYCQNRGAKTVTITASNPSNPRRDLIVLRVQDAAYSGAVNSWSISVVTGTPAAVPVDPAVPANSIVIARVAVAAAATSITNGNITDLRQFGATRGGETVCKSTARPSVPYVGQRIYEADTFKHLVFQSVATGWTPEWNTPWGAVADISYSSSNQVISSTSFVDLTGMSLPSVPVVANRWYEIICVGHYFQATTGGVCGFAVSVSGSPTAYGLRADDVPTGLNVQIPITVMGRVKFSASGTQTFKMQGAAITGGNLTVYNNIAPITMWIKDIGPAGNPL